MIPLHPALLWGLGLVAVPVVIHLLLRQRPRPRPWAAMRWLLAAHRQASRRWRLTNLLLLLLRCLAVALLALAVSRPSLPGIGGGAHLVVVLDRSASMGARGGDPGPLAQAQAALAAAELPYARWTLVAVDGGAEAVADGAPGAVREALARLAARPLPGGLDDAARGPAAEALGAAVPAGADVLLVSDFQQDDGGRCAALLAPRARRVARWAVGTPAPNRYVAGPAAAADLRPGEPGELALQLGGPAGAVRLAVDDGPALTVLARAGGAVRLALPPLPAGPHRCRIELADGGLAYDDVLELPLAVRPPLPALAVAERSDYLVAALDSDPGACAVQRVRPGAFGTAALPAGGVVALRSPVPDAARLAGWVRGGGVLWAPLDLLLADPALAPLAGGIARREEAAAGGAYACGEPDLDGVLHLAVRPQVRAASLPAEAQVLLRAGAAPLAVAVPAGGGFAVAELDDLAGDQALAARGTVPLWVARSVRRLAAQAEAPRWWTAGQAVPEAAKLARGGRQVAFAAGAPLRLEPGIWDAGGRQVAVLPSPEEARTEGAPPAGAGTDLAGVLPARPGRDLGLWLLIAALLAAVAEMSLAHWAGRRHGG